MKPERMNKVGNKVGKKVGNKKALKFTKAKNHSNLTKIL